jgi:hypothetical protein
MCRRADLVWGGRCPGGVETSSRLDRHDRRPSQGKRQRPTHRAIECALIVAEMTPRPASATFCAHSVGGTAPWPAGSPTSPTSTSTGPGERRQPETHPQPAPLAHRPDQCRQPHPDRRGSLPDDVRRAPSQDPHRRCALVWPKSGHMLAEAAGVTPRPSRGAFPGRRRTAITERSGSGLPG